MVIGARQSGEEGADFIDPRRLFGDRDALSHEGRDRPSKGGPDLVRVVVEELGDSGPGGGAGYASEDPW